MIKIDKSPFSLRFQLPLEKDPEKHSEQHKGSEEEKPLLKKKEKKLTSEELTKAVEAFCDQDISIKALGLKGEVTQQPQIGLTVVLTDPTGLKIRQISGQAFLDLQERHSSFLKRPGKILDQKF